ncbi:MAG TPA: CRISPR-associated endonuclease Cas3'' [Nitrososphaera sp.]|nr:CRISPR-associated endonuclease Cas3'' [Nitrososphaera sp.]
MMPCAYEKQSLESHSQGVAKIALAFANDQYIEVCRRRLLRTGVNLEKHTIRSIILLSALLHDIGKSARYYQKQFDKTCIPVIDHVPSFYLHEISSAAISKRICDYNNFDTPISFFVVASVLQHLHAIRGIDKDRVINDAINRFAKNKELLIFEDHWLKLYEMTNKACLLYGVNTNLNQDLFQNLHVSEITNLFAWVSKIAQNRNIRWPKLYILFLNPILVGDNIDAESNRNESQESRNRSPFMRELASTLGGA